MIEIEKLGHKDWEGVKQISLSEQQIKYAATANEFLTEQEQNVHLHIIKSDGKIIGYFKLDLGYSSKYDFCPTLSLGIRSYVIDQRLQGKGLGSAAGRALIDYAKQHYPQFNFIYLTVNCKNTLAKACYLKAGLIEANTLYHGGPCGPQHIMYADLTT